MAGFSLCDGLLFYQALHPCCSRSGLGSVQQHCLTLARQHISRSRLQMLLRVHVAALLAKLVNRQHAKKSHSERTWSTRSWISAAGSKSALLSARVTGRPEAPRDTRKRDTCAGSNCGMQAEVRNTASLSSGRGITCCGMLLEWCSWSASA